MPQAQAAEENDLNVLMVQFIVMAVKLLVEAAFNKDKGQQRPSPFSQNRFRNSMRAMNLVKILRLIVLACSRVAYASLVLGEHSISPLNSHLAKH